MKYETITIESIGKSQDYIIIDKGNDEFESFPVDETNPRYIQFVEENKK
jgi:hypothetical protein